MHCCTTHTCTYISMYVMTKYGILNGTVNASLVAKMEWFWFDFYCTLYTYTSVVTILHMYIHPYPVQPTPLLNCLQECAMLRINYTLVYSPVYMDTLKRFGNWFNLNQFTCKRSKTVCKPI